MQNDRQLAILQPSRSEPQPISLPQQWNVFRNFDSIFFFLLHLEANDTSAALYPLNPLNLVALRTTLIFCTILKLNWINKN